MKRHRVCTSLKTKYLCLKDLEKGGKQKDLATKYGVQQSTIAGWVRKKKDILGAFESGNIASCSKRNNAMKFEKVDKALFTWFQQKRSSSIPLSGPIMLEKANQFAASLYDGDAKISASWLNRWKSRHGIVCKIISGEDKSVHMDVVSSWTETTLPTLLSKYALKDVFNGDEFGLFYAAVPKTSLQLKGEKCSGGKRSKIRITGLVCSNALGEKLPILVIGK